MISQHCLQGKNPKVANPQGTDLPNKVELSCTVLFQLELSQHVLFWVGGGGGGVRGEHLDH